MHRPNRSTVHASEKIEGATQHAQRGGRLGELVDGAFEENMSERRMRHAHTARVVYVAAPRRHGFKCLRHVPQRHDVMGCSQGGLRDVVCCSRASDAFEKRRHGHGRVGEVDVGRREGRQRRRRRDGGGGVIGGGRGCGCVGGGCVCGVPKAVKKRHAALYVASAAARASFDDLMKHVAVVVVVAVVLSPGP